ncbi:MAG: DegV family protein [Proteobacteria bacterium]|nr:DegV family protein [Pseudomonadota bacterium]
MDQYFTIVSRTVPDYLADQVGREKLARLFTLIEEKKSRKQIIASGVVDHQEADKVLLQLVTGKVVVPADSAIIQEKIMLVTDSAADLPPELVRDRNITVVPLSVTIDGRQYRDGVDISPLDFYRLLKKSATFPVTSPPSLEDFQRLFLDNIGDKDILGIFLSKRMSKTFDIANQAMRSKYNSCLRQRRANPAMDNRFHIELIDSRQVSMGAGLLVLEASDKIRAGWPLPQIKNHIEKLVEEVRVFFMVDDLDYLARGGRIGRGYAFLGNFFGFKPILGMNGGGVDAKSRVLGGRRAQSKLIDLMKDDLKNSGKAIRIGICHADCPEKVENIKKMINSAFPGQEPIISYFGPTVGSHTGPGSVGVVWLASSSDKAEQN